MLDMKIINATIVDGGGRPGFRGDVGVSGGRIVAVGEVAEAARETLDAAGKIVSPGFIDVHTHYDAQVFWDPKLSPSCYHGVTTVIGGFCGFSIAPLTSDAGAYLKPMLARVEGMPLAVLEAAVPWDWSSFGDYLARIEAQGIGVNAGFFCGHSALRRVVMGARAIGERATADDVAKMVALLDASLAEGALGFSTTISPTHNDADGNPVPSRWADYSEIIALGRVVRDHEGAGLELLPDVDFGAGVPELLAEFSIAGQRPVNWNVMAITGSPDTVEKCARQLAVSDFARARGGEVIALTVPCPPELYVNLFTGFVFDSIPGVWRQIFKMPVAERMVRFRDPDFRRRMAADAGAVPDSSNLSVLARIDRYSVVAAKTPRNKKYEGRQIGDIAAEDGREPIDVMLDIAIEEDLLTTFAPFIGGYDHRSYERRAELWRDDRTLIGASDAGAHLDMIDTFAFSTTLLEKGVREHKVIGLEEAVQKITQRPARYFGLVDRGLIVPGYHADLVVFDAETVGRGPTYLRQDLPGDPTAFRIYADAIGIEHVMVNGVRIIADGVHTGALPGAVLRSGRDTRTPPMTAMRDERAPA